MPIDVSYLPRHGVYLYLISGFGRENEPIGPVKIGISSNVATRLASVQTGCHRALQVLAVFGTPNRDIAREREAAFHQEFAVKRLEGEWFDVDPINALETVCAIWRHYFQQMPEGIESVGVPFYEREVKVLRCWRQYYAENSNVQAIG